MSLKSNVGEVSVSSKGVHWTIPNFSGLPQIPETRIISPSFQFKNRGWYIYFYPKGRSCLESSGWLGIAALPDTPFTSNECNFHLGIADEQGRSIISCQAVIYDNKWYQSLKFIPHVEFISRKNEFMPKGTLHILFGKMNEEAEPFYSDRNFASSYHNFASFYHRNTEVNTVEGGRNIFKRSHDGPSKEVSVQTDKVKETSSFKQKFWEMLLNESITDIVLKVQDQEFRAHRFVLAAHSPVFLAMMTQDMKEKATGVIDIEDVDPNVFPDFLHFLYTGNVENLSSEKALKLYSVADKYVVKELKESCLDHLQTNISVYNFCDVIAFSVQHNEILLKEACFQFFLDNSLDIIMTTNWQTFLRENSTIGNELFISYVQMVKSNKLYCEK